jgi:hypothetical protein
MREDYQMDWVLYIMCLAGGAFLANGVPHFVAGISGKKFHSPFSRPPVKGLSSAVVNVIWGSVNFSIAYLLLKLGNADWAFNLKTLMIGLGIVITALALAVTFSRVDKH